MALKPITVTASTSLTRNTHSGAVVVLDNATGKTITLPASTGKGDVYTIYIKTTVSSGNHVIQVANGTVFGLSPFHFHGRSRPKLKDSQHDCPGWSQQFPRSQQARLRPWWRTGF